MANGKGNERGVIYLPPEIWAELRVEAARRKMSMGDVVLEALELRAGIVVTQHSGKD